MTAGTLTCLGGLHKFQTLYWWSLNRKCSCAPVFKALHLQTHVGFFQLECSVYGESTLSYRL
jgi:hypothetical protein